MHTWNVSCLCSFPFSAPKTSSLTFILSRGLGRVHSRSSDQPQGSLNKGALLDLPILSDRWTLSHLTLYSETPAHHPPRLNMSRQPEVTRNLRDMSNQKQRQKQISQKKTTLKSWRQSRKKFGKN